MTKELFELLERGINYLGSIAADLGYFANKARQEDARDNPPPPAPPAPPAPEDER